MAVPFVDLKAQYHSIKAEIDAALIGTMESCAFTLGPEVLHPAGIVDLAVKIGRARVETPLGDDVGEGQRRVIGVVIADPRRQLRIKAGRHFRDARFRLADAGDGGGQVRVLGKGQVDGVRQAERAAGNGLGKGTLSYANAKNR